jgi:hypothetical protein
MTNPLATTIMQVHQTTPIKTMTIPARRMTRSLTMARSSSIPANSNKPPD